MKRGTIDFLPYNPVPLQTGIHFANVIQSSTTDLNYEELFMKAITESCKSEGKDATGNVEGPKDIMTYLRQLDNKSFCCWKYKDGETFCAIPVPGNDKFVVVDMVSAYMNTVDFPDGYFATNGPKDLVLTDVYMSTNDTEPATVIPKKTASTSSSKRAKKDKEEAQI